jgi:hypothetical protein
LIKQGRNRETVEKIVLVGVDAAGKSLGVEKGEPGVQSQRVQRLKTEPL